MNRLILMIAVLMTVPATCEAQFFTSTSTYSYGSNGSGGLLARIGQRMRANRAQRLSARAARLNYVNANSMANASSRGGFSSGFYYQSSYVPMTYNLASTGSTLANTYSNCARCGKLINGFGVPVANSTSIESTSPPVFIESDGWLGEQPSEVFSTGPCINGYCPLPPQSKNVVVGIRESLLTKARKEVTIEDTWL